MVRAFIALSSFQTFYIAFTIGTRQKFPNYHVELGYLKHTKLGCPLRVYLVETKHSMVTRRLDFCMQNQIVVKFQIMIRDSTH